MRDNFALHSLHQQTVNSFPLQARIASVHIWTARRNLAVKFVSGLIATRISQLTNRQEVLLVRGSSNGRPKSFWQFPGGHVMQYDDHDEDHIFALYREIREELGVTLPAAPCYVDTFIPKPKPGDRQVLAIHAFRLPDCPWDSSNVTMGSDVNQMIWTDDPLRDVNGDPRVLTTQTDYMLRNHLGYTGPANPNTEPDRSYDGKPDICRSLPRLVAA